MNITELARQAGIGWAEGLGGMTEFLQRFHDLAIQEALADYRQRLLDGVGEPVARVDVVVNKYGHREQTVAIFGDVDENDSLYTADQLAAAVAETEEQARLNAMGSEREARLMARVAELEAAVEREREECAKAAEGVLGPHKSYGLKIVNKCAAAIRARKD
jgi:hypothetical protein